MDQSREVFSVDLLERYAAKGRGVITCMAAGNDVIMLGTSKGWVIMHDFGVGDSYEIDLSAGWPGEQSVHRVFVDPGGSHCVATVVGSGGADTFYTYAKWNRPRGLTRLRGLIVNDVAWNRQQITEASTREVILGMENGQLYEMAVDEKDKREKYVKSLYESTELPEAFMGLQMETASMSSGTRYYVMAVTPTRMYSFTGIGSLEVATQVFSVWSMTHVSLIAILYRVDNGRENDTRTVRITKPQSSMQTLESSSALVPLPPDQNQKTENTSEAQTKVTIDNSPKNETIGKRTFALQDKLWSIYAAGNTVPIPFLRATDISPIALLSDNLIGSMQGNSGNMITAEALQELFTGDGQSRKGRRLQNEMPLPASVCQRLASSSTLMNLAQALQYHKTCYEKMPLQEL